MTPTVLVTLGLAVAAILHKPLLHTVVIGLAFLSVLTFLRREINFLEL
jgi:hypothetical protein